MPELTGRFWDKVAIPDDRDDCWLWKATTINSGYGRFYWEGRLHLAHRVVYQVYCGSIPDGYTVDHTCHNRDPLCPGGNDCLHRRCVNPNHLTIATRRDNILNGKTLPAANVVKTHCPQGHPYSPENTRIIKCRDGRRMRQCRECDRERQHNLRHSVRHIVISRSGR